VIWFIDHGGDPEECDASNNTCLSLACIWNHCELVSALLDRKANLFAKNYYGNTPMHAICRRGMLTVVERFGLLFDANVQNAQLENLLHSCLLHFVQTNKCQSEKLAIVNILLNQSDLCLNAKNASGNTALHLACSFANCDAIRLLLNHGARHDIRNGAGLVPFQCAFNSCIDRDAALETLLSCNVPVTRPAEIDGETLYSIVESVSKRPIVCAALIRSLVDLNLLYQEIGGRTFLQQACFRYHVNLAKILILEHASLSVPGNDGKTALHEMAGYDKLLRFTEANRISLDMTLTDSEGRLPIHHLARRYRNNEDTFESILKLHIKHGANINSRDIFGCSPLFYACENEHPSWELKLWLQYGADRNLIDKNGREVTLLE
jgi:ankyrin repeat protein